MQWPGSGQLCDVAHSLWHAAHPPTQLHSLRRPFKWHKLRTYSNLVTGHAMRHANQLKHMLLRCMHCKPTVAHQQPRCLRFQALDTAKTQ